MLELASNGLTILPTRTSLQGGGVGPWKAQHLYNRQGNRRVPALHLAQQPYRCSSSVSRKVVGRPIWGRKERRWLHFGSWSSRHEVCWLEVRRCFIPWTVFENVDTNIMCSATLKLSVLYCLKGGNQSELSTCLLLQVIMRELGLKSCLRWYLTDYAHCRGGDWRAARYETIGQYARIQRFECRLCFGRGYCKYPLRVHMVCIFLTLNLGQWKRYYPSVLWRTSTMVGQGCVDRTNWPRISIAHRGQCNAQTGKYLHIRQTWKNTRRIHANFVLRWKSSTSLWTTVLRRSTSCYMAWMDANLNWETSIPLT